jgi:multisubunit Na+/H+ antiporter MnhG subunit
VSDELSSGTFLVTTVLLDIVFLAAIYSGVLPFDVPSLLVAFALFVVSPVLAYLVARPRPRSRTPG